MGPPANGQEYSKTLGGKRLRKLEEEYEARSKGHKLRLERYRCSRSARVFVDILRILNFIPKEEEAIDRFYTSDTITSVFLKDHFDFLMNGL